MTEPSAAPGPDAPQPDFMDDRTIDPHREYARLRGRCPVAHLASRGGLRSYVVTGYEDAKAVLADPRLHKDPRTLPPSPQRDGMARIFEAPLSRHMLTADPPEHTRLRRLVSAQFTVRRTELLRPRVQQIADELIDVFAAKGEADFVHDFAAQLPTLVIAELLGVPAEDRSRFRRWADELLRPPGDPSRDSAEEQFTAYVDAQIARKRAEPADDLVSALVAGRQEERLSEAELRGTVFLLLIAGYETTTNLLGNGMLALLRHPDQYALLRARPDLVPNAVEEFLRYDAPVERSSLRMAAEDLEIAGTPVPEGSIVMAALMSANRDGRVFEEPDRLDITRPVHGAGTHLAFGHGIHYCLGAPLARLEGQVAFETLMRRLPRLELAVPADQLAYRPAALMRALVSLPIRFAPAPVPA